MPKVALSDVPLDLIQYLQKTHPQQSLQKLPDGQWENPLDAAERTGFQNCINFLIFLRGLQIDPSLREGTEMEDGIMVEVNEDGNITEAIHVLRATR